MRLSLLTPDGVESCGEFWTDQDGVVQGDARAQPFMYGRAIRGAVKLKPINVTDALGRDLGPQDGDDYLWGLARRFQMSLSYAPVLYDDDGEPLRELPEDRE